MAMVENSGMGLSKDMARHGNLSVGLGSLSPHWYHPPSLSSLSPNQANLRSGPDPNTHPPPPSLSYHYPSLSSSSSAKEASLLLPEKTKENKKEDQVGSQEQEKEREKDQEKEKEKDRDREKEREKENCVDPQHAETESDGDNSKKVAGIAPDPIRTEERPLADGGEIVVVRKLEEDRFSTLNPLAKEFVPPSKVVGPTTKGRPDSEPVTKGNTNRKVGSQEQEKEREKDQEKEKEKDRDREKEREKENCVDPQHAETESDGDNSKKVAGIAPDPIRTEERPLADGGEIVVVRKLEEDRFSTLNPLAKEFVPPSKVVGPTTKGRPDSEPVTKGNTNCKKKGNSNQGKRRINSRILKAQREESIQRTVYVSDIDQQVTEEQLAALFISCSQVVDCRICGDPNSVLRFAFVEFTNEEGARAALGLSGTKLGFYPVRVLPSKTAIVPVNPTFLPRSELERELCARTIYCTNIDKKVSQAEVKLFFETLCGEVSRLRLLGDFHHSTRIAFVEFIIAESAMYALNCSGAILGSLPIRVSPSKTPVRPCGPRSHPQ